MTYQSIAKFVLGYNLTEKQAKKVSQRYTLKAFNSKCYKVVMGTDLEYQRFIAWLDSLAE